MQKINILLPFLIQFIYLINNSHQFISIDDFGAIKDDPSYEAAMRNGEALFYSLLTANKSTSDRTVLVPANFYGMLPAGSVDRLINVTLQIDGTLNSWDLDHSRYPINSGGHVLNFIDLPNSENLIIKGSGIIEGNGYLWWLNVIETGIDNRADLIELDNSKNLLIDGITLKNAPQYHINVRSALNATFLNIVIKVDVVFNRTTAVTFPLNTGF